MSSIKKPSSSNLAVGIAPIYSRFNTRASALKCKIDHPFERFLDLRHCSKNYWKTKTDAVLAKWHLDLRSDGHSAENGVL